MENFFLQKKNFFCVEDGKFFFRKKKFFLGSDENFLGQGNMDLGCEIDPDRENHPGQDSETGFATIGVGIVFDQFFSIS